MALRVDGWDLAWMGGWVIMWMGVGPWMDGIYSLRSSLGRMGKDGHLWYNLSIERMGQMSYNGWTNYATWNIPLWADNEYPLYKLRCDLLKECTRPITAGWVKRFFAAYMGGTTPDLTGNDWEGGRISDVNWDEIAEHWEDERQELLDYS